MHTSHQIPPLLHFIWAGGNNLMTKEGIDLVSEWIKQNHTVEKFQAWLWVDNKTATKSLVTDYKKLFGQNEVIVLDKPENTTSILTETGPCLTLKDIREHKLSDEYVTYEIEKLRPNYGSSSDLLRYNILFQYGGFYCDCTDVAVGKTNLSEIFAQEFKRPVLFLDHRPQQPMLSLEELKEFRTDQLGNDTFLVTGEHNMLALKLILTAKKNYELPETFFKSHVVIAHSGNNMKESTIARTGPGLVRQAFVEPSKLELAEGALIVKEGEIRRVRDGIIALTTPTENTGCWLNTRITKYENPEDAFTAVFTTIEFEAKHFKIFRLDDHIKDLMMSTGRKIDIKNVLIKLDNFIETKKLSFVYTQLTGEYIQSIEYTFDKKLTTIFDLSKEDCILAINAQGYLNDLLKAEKVATIQKDALSKQAKKMNMTVIGLILGSQRQTVKINLCIQIKQGLEFFEQISQHIDKFKGELTKKIQNYLIDQLKKYKEYAEILKATIPKEYHVESEKIDLLLKKLVSEDKHMVRLPKYGF